MMNLIKSLAVLGSLVASTHCFSETLSSLQDSNTDASWSHWWNANGELGDPRQYIEMAASDEEDKKFIALKNDPSWLFVGLLSDKGHVGQIGGLPGPGPEQTDKHFGYAAIFSYTLSRDGKISLAHSSLSTIYESRDGITISIFVNSEMEPRIVKATEAGQISEVSFDVSLGDLNAGDTIYFAISPNQNNFGDSFGIDCDVVLGK